MKRPVKLIPFDIKDIVGDDPRWSKPEDPLKAAELKLIERQIENLSTMPDFGYGAGNYLIDFQDRPRNWELLSGLILKKDKFAWLENHIKLTSLKKTLTQIQHEREQAKNKKLQLVELIRHQE